MVTPHMHKNSTTLQRSINAKNCNKIGHFTKMCFTKNAQPQSQQQYKRKPKQAYEIIIPQQPNEKYEGIDKSDDDDDFIITYEMCAQPQKTE